MDVLQLIKTKSVIYETISMAAGRLAQGHMGYYEVNSGLSDFETPVCYQITHSYF